MSWPRRIIRAIRTAWRLDEQSQQDALNLAGLMAIFGTAADDDSTGPEGTPGRGNG